MFEKSEKINFDSTFGKNKSFSSLSDRQFVFPYINLFLF